MRSGAPRGRLLGCGSPCPDGGQGPQPRQIGPGHRTDRGQREATALSGARVAGVQRGSDGDAFDAVGSEPANAATAVHPHVDPGTSRTDHGPVPVTSHPRVCRGVRLYS